MLLIFTGLNRFLLPYPAPADSADYAEATRIHLKWYAIVCVETVTGWPQVIITHTFFSEDSARKIVDHLVSRYGAFTVLHIVFKEVMNLLHMKKTRSAPLCTKG